MSAPDREAVRQFVNDWCEYAARQRCTPAEFERGVELIESEPDYYVGEGDLTKVLRDVRPEKPREYDPAAFRVRV